MPAGSSRHIEPLLPSSHHYTQTLTAGLSFTGSRSQQIAKSLLAGLSFNATMSRLKVFTRTFTAGLSFTGSQAKNISRTLVAGLSFTGGMSKKIVRTLTAGLFFGIEKNLVPDPSFEYDANGSAPSTSLWVSAATAGMTINTFAVSNTWAASGSQSLHIQATHDATSTSEDIGLETPAAGALPASAGTVYTMQATFNVIQAGNVGIELKFLWDDINGTQLSTSVSGNFNPGTTGIFTVNFTATAPASTAFMRIFPQILSSTPSQVIEYYIDDIIVTQGSQTPAYFDGDFSNCSWTGTPGASPSVQGSQMFKAIDKAPLTAGLSFQGGGASTPAFVQEVNTTATATTTTAAITGVTAGDFLCVAGASKDSAIGASTVVITAISDSTGDTWSSVFGQPVYDGSLCMWYNSTSGGATAGTHTLTFTWTTFAFSSPNFSYTIAEYSGVLHGSSLDVEASNYLVSGSGTTINLGPTGAVAGSGELGVLFAIAAGNNDWPLTASSISGTATTQRQNATVPFGLSTYLGDVLSLGTGTQTASATTTATAGFEYGLGFATFKPGTGGGVSPLLKAITHGVTAGLSFTGVLTSARTHIVNLIAGLSFTGQFTKNVQRLFTASLGFSGSFARQTTKNLTAGLSFSGRTIKNVVKTALTAGLSFAGSVASARTHIVNLAAGLSFAGGFFKQTTKDLTAGLSFTGAALTKNIGKSLTAGLSFTGHQTKQIIKTLYAALMPGAITYYDFENNVTSFTATFGTVAQVLGISHSGNASAQVTSNGSGIVQLYKTGGFPWDSGNVVPGQTYLLTAYVLSGTTPHSFVNNVAWYNSGGTLINDTSGPSVLSSTTVWTQLTYQVVAPAGAAGVLSEVRSVATPSNGEITYIDDMSIVPVNADLTKNIVKAPLTAGLSFAGSVLKATVKSLVAAGLSFTGAFNSARTHLINLTAGLSFSGAFTKSVGKNLMAGVSFAGAQAKQIGHYLAAGLSFTGSIVKAIVRAPFTAGLSFAGVMNSARTHLVNLFAGLSFTGNSLAKQIGKSLTAGLSFAGGFTKNVVKTAFKAGLSFTGSFTKQTTKMLTAGLSFAGKLSKGTVHNLAAGLSFTGGLTKHIIRAAMTAGLSFSGSVAKAVDRTISAGLTFAGSLKRSTVYVILFTAGVSFAGLVSRAISRTLTASVAFAGGFLKQIVKRLTAAAVGFSGAVSATLSTMHNYVITFVAGMGFGGTIHGVTGTLKRAWRGAVGRIVKEPQGPAPAPPEPTTVTRGGSGRVVDQPQQPDAESPSESSTTKTRGAGPR